MIERAWSDRGGFGRGARRRTAAALLVAASGALMGCEADSWLLDYSVVGRWEYTPTTVPILERLDVIERQRTDYVEPSMIQPEDLIPEVSEYEVGPGDVLQIEIFDFIQPNQAEQFQRPVDPRGFIDLPQIGRVNVLGLTTDGVRETLRRVLREKGLIQDALISVQVPQQRQQTFAVIGLVPRVGRYFIPSPNYKLLEALTEAGGIPPVAVPKIYIIRQAPLTEAAKRGAGVERAPSPGAEQQHAPGQPADQGKDLQSLIEELTKPQQGQPANPAPPPAPRPQPEPSPGFVFVGPATRPAAPKRAYQAAADQGQSTPTTQGHQAPPAGEPPAPPPIDLPEESAPPHAPAPAARPGAAAPSPNATSGGAGRWMFLNGEWVRVSKQAAAAPAGLPEGGAPLAAASKASELVTQRVIEVPTAPLLQGSAEYNVIVRPGDIINVPPPDGGFVYLGGPGIARGGTYSLPERGRLTLSRAILAAGGFNSIAAPWKVDLTRLVGDDRQATIRLNLRAIFEGTQPDVFLREGDIINVGTSFFATPTAVIRNGFRMSYGFGFLLDRNFGNDVFGAPPTNINGQ